MIQFINFLLLISVIIFSSPRFSDCASNEWTSCRGPEGGTVWKFGIDFKNSQTIYAGTYQGIFKSTNGGASWVRSSNGLNQGLPTGLVINPLNPDILYVSLYGGGVFKSIDGAANWIQVNSGITNLGISELAINPITPNTVYAVTNRSGVFKTIDGGSNWTHIGPSSPGNECESIALDPSDPNIIYVGHLGYGDIKVSKSTNGGDSWSDNSSGFPTSSCYIFDLAVSPYFNDTVYAGTSEGIFMTTNGGANWTSVNTGTVYSKITKYIDFDANSSNIIYGGNSGGVFKSSDGGQTWGYISTGLDGYLMCLTPDPQQSNVLFAGTEMGIFKTTDGGSNWKSVNYGLSATKVNSLAIGADGALYAGTEQGIHRAFLDCSGWSLLYSGSLLNANSIITDPNSLGTVYVSSSGYGVLRTIDGGLNWTCVNNNGTYCLAFDQSNNAVYAGTSGIVYKTTNHGENWSIIAEGLGTGPIWDIIVDSNAPGTIYAATGMKVYKTIDYGLHWSYAGLTTTDLLYSLADDPSNEGTLYAGNMSGEVYKTINGGESWNRVLLVPKGGYNEVWGIYIDPDSPNVIYVAARDAGLFRSVNSGLTWNAFNDGLAGNYQGACFALDNVNQKLYVGTLGGGVFVRDKPLINKPSASMPWIPLLLLNN